MISFMITTRSLNSQDMIRILKQWRHNFSGKHLCGRYCMDIMMFMCWGQNSWFCKASLKETKYWRHIKLNPTNVALLLEETTQKYQKLTDYWKKSSSLFSVLSVYCDLCFLSPSSMAELFHFLSKVVCEFQTSQVIIRAVYSFVFWFENDFHQV